MAKPVWKGEALQGDVVQSNWFSIERCRREKPVRDRWNVRAGAGGALGRVIVGNAEQTGHGCWRWLRLRHCEHRTAPCLVGAAWSTPRDAGDAVRRSDSNVTEGVHVEFQAAADAHHVARGKAGWATGDELDERAIAQLYCDQCLDRSSAANDQCEAVRAANQALNSSNSNKAILVHNFFPVVTLYEYGTKTVLCAQKREMRSIAKR